MVLIDADRLKESITAHKSECVSPELRGALQAVLVLIEREPKITIRTILRSKVRRWFKW